MSLLSNFQDLATVIKFALNKKADKSEIPSVPVIDVLDSSRHSLVGADRKAVIPAAGFEALELSFDFNTGDISTTKTVSEIIALYNEGKCFGGSINMGDDNSPICVQFHFGVLKLDSGTYSLFASYQSANQSEGLEFTASSLNSVFTASLIS